MKTDWLPSGRLGRQIAIAFVLFGAILSVVMGLGLVSALRSVERIILDETLTTQLSQFRLQFDNAPVSETVHSGTIVTYAIAPHSDNEIPAHLRTLSPGFHDISNQERDYRVLVEERDGFRYIGEFDSINILKRERQFINWVWYSSMAVLIASLLFGCWTGSRFSRPSQQLAQQIRTLSEQPHGSLDLSQFKNDEIGLLAQRLQNYHVQLNDLLTREREFAGNVSHELRTPVTNISLAAEVLASTSRLSDMDRDRVRRIQRAVGEMSELVDTFLILAQIDQQEEEQFSACELRPVVDDVIQIQRVWLGNKPVTVTIDEQSPVSVAAPSRVLSVLIANLVRNAFRYTQQGQITVTLAGNAVCVMDTGTGINDFTKSTLFERHPRGDIGNTDGAGLGLLIVKRICERYHWSVSVKSLEAQGSSFTINFAPESKVG